MIGIVVSRADEVSVRIGRQLRDLTDWTATRDDTRPPAAGGGTVRQTDGFELRTFEERHLYLEDAAAAFDDPALIAFVSRHAGETGPLLTAHVTGNVASADHGGDPRSLATPCPGGVAGALDAFDRYAPADYDAGLECTHHGPSSVGAPSLFVELGSGEPQWTDDEAARTVARSVLSLRGTDPFPGRHLLVVGDGHYAPRATRIVRETDWTVGHVLSDWALADAGTLDDDVFRQAIELSQAAHVLVTGDRPAVEAAARRRGCRVVDETWVRETDGVELDVVETLETALSPVTEGLRFGAVAREDPDGPFGIYHLPEPLLSAAHGVDRAATVAAVEEGAVAYETDEGGNRIDGRVALRDGDDAASPATALLSALGDVLAREYDAVEVTASGLRAERSVFDPAAARDRGVPEGPAFGRLADGEAVTVDGVTVEPATVHRSETLAVDAPARQTRVEREGKDK